MLVFFVAHLFAQDYQKQVSRFFISLFLRVLDLLLGGLDVGEFHASSAWHRRGLHEKTQQKQELKIGWIGGAEWVGKEEGPRDSKWRARARVCVCLYVCSREVIAPLSVVH